MKKIYTTAQGKQVSMDSVRLSNETVIAVGNMKVNARGDQLGPGGVPEKSRRDTVNEYHNLHTPVAGGAAPVGGKIVEDVQVEVPPSADPLIDEQDEIEIAPVPVTTQPEMRGKLADAVAKTAVVNQELLKPMKQQIKDRGPSRI
jgi:hypothetical protein